MEPAVLVTGSNLGDRERNLSEALQMIGARCGKVLKASRVYESDPWGDVEGTEGEPAGAFMNQAILLHTGLEPDELLRYVKEVESEMGREAVPPVGRPDGSRKYFSRIIDIDIIFYGSRTVVLPGLEIPHPLMAQREFVLRPVAEIASGWEHPGTGLTPVEMLAGLGQWK